MSSSRWHRPDPLLTPPDPLLAPQVYHALGSFGPVVVCTHITNTVHMLAPLTLRTVNVDVNAYYRAPYTAIVRPHAQHAKARCGMIRAR